MAALTGEQVAQAAYQAGFRGDGLWRIVAITGRESTWNPGAHNDSGVRYPAGDKRNTGDDSWGLAQINTLGTNGPVISRILGQLGYNPANFGQLLDPVVNLRVAYVLSGSGTNWRPWGPYKGVSELTGTDPAAAQQAVARATSQGLLGQPLAGGFGATVGSGGGGGGGGTEGSHGLGGALANLPGDAASSIVGIPGDVIGAITGVATGWVKDLFQVAQPFLLYAVVLAGGAGLILLGARKAVDPIVSKKQQEAEQLAPLAMAAV